MSAKKIWLGPLPEKCDICGDPELNAFVDGKTQFGPWGTMCLACHKRHGCGLGVGKGQLYIVKSKTVAEKSRLAPDAGG